MNQLEGIEPSSPNNGGGYASRGNDNGELSVSIVQLDQQLGSGRDGVVFRLHTGPVRSGFWLRRVMALADRGLVRFLALKTGSDRGLVRVFAKKCK